MIGKELRIIIDEGEGYKIEFKESLSSIDKDIVAFANASGGRIFVGITDDKKVIGLSNTTEVKTRIQDIANNCRPKVKIIIDQYQNIVTADVREGTDKPYECSSGFYKRMGPNSQKMTRDEIIDFIKAEGKVRFDELIEPRFSYPKDFDKKRMLRFLALAGLSKSTRTEIILVNLGVAEKQEGRLYFKNAGILFFAKDPQSFIPWSVYTVALFKDTEGVDIIDRKEIVGTLFEIVDQVMDFIKLYSKVAYRFTGKPQRENVYEYPFEAIREAVINSILHKYYFEHGHNNILRFLPNQIKIENYWQKPKHFVIGQTVFRRNPLLVDLFARIHYGEKIGTGFRRMKGICKKENSPAPKITLDDNYFYIAFAPSYQYLRLVEKETKITESLNARQKKVIDYLKKAGKMTVKEYMLMCHDVNRRTLTRDMNYLIKMGLVMRKGKGKRDLFYVLL